MPNHPTPKRLTPDRLWWAARGLLTLIVVGGLAVDAYVHLDLAASYDMVKSSVLSQGDLFRAEAALAILAAALLVVRLRRYSAAFALLVYAGGAGAGAVLLYQYVDVGALGPLPDMYEPVWYPEKTYSLWGEAVGAAAALALLLLTHLHLRRTRRASHELTSTSAVPADTRAGRQAECRPGRLAPPRPRRASATPNVADSPAALTTLVGDQRPSSRSRTRSTARADVDH